MKPYQKKCVLDKEIKPLILKWLSQVFGYENYPHSFADQWILWGVWNRELSVVFDLRQEEQVKLLSLIHPRFKGTIQHKTLKVINEYSFCIQLKDILSIKYPEIIDNKLLSVYKYKGDESDFYEYTWEVFLSDNTSIVFTSQESKIDFKKVCNDIIEEREFINFLENIK